MVSWSKVDVMYSKIVIKKNYFSSEWVDKLNTMMSTIDFDPNLGKTNLRKVNVKLVTPQLSIYNKVFNDLMLATYQHLHTIDVDINHAIDGNTMQYLVYGPGDYVTQHNDTLAVHNSSNHKINRKVSITVMLSDPSEFTGGEFVFDKNIQLPENEFSGKGTVAIFTSHSKNLVKPVLTGQRKVLFAFVTGPEWR